MVSVDTLQLHVASASVLQAGQTIFREKGKGPLHYMLVLAPAKGESKVLPLTWHMCQ